MENDPLCIHWDVPVAICLRLSECDERSRRSFDAAEAIYYTHTYNGSLGTTTIPNIYSALHNANA